MLSVRQSRSQYGGLLRHGLFSPQDWRLGFSHECRLGRTQRFCSMPQNATASARNAKRVQHGKRVDLQAAINRFVVDHNQQRDEHSSDRSGW